MYIPVIGLTANTQPPVENRSAQHIISDAYVQSILRAGGAPVILPSDLKGDALDSVLKKLDGLLITGGSDIDPARYRGISHPRVYGVDTDRDELEIQAIRKAAELGKPFFGICRGIQAINVALGGSLYSDITDQKEGSLKHDCHPEHPRDYLAHDVSLQPGSRLEKILGGQKAQVNSMHHQGVWQIAPILKPMAYAPDGLIEGVELPGHPFGLGVQWHPECLPDREEQRALFAAFIQACQRQ